MSDLHDFANRVWIKDRVSPQNPNTYRWAGGMSFNDPIIDESGSTILDQGP